VTGEEDSDSIIDHETDEHSESQNTIPLPKHHRHSYVWRYFTPVPDHLEVYRCKICSETFGNKTTNLGRHLQTIHGVNDVVSSLQMYMCILFGKKFVFIIAS